MPLYTTIERSDNGTYLLPPDNVALSDELVYIVTKQVRERARGARWPADFDQNGSIRPTHMPRDSTPISYPHSLPLCEYGAQAGRI